MSCCTRKRDMSGSGQRCGDGAFPGFEHRRFTDAVMREPAFRFERGHAPRAGDVIDDYYRQAVSASGTGNGRSAAAWANRPHHPASPHR